MEFLSIARTSSGKDIPRLRIVLFKLNLMNGNNLALGVEDEEAGAGSPLVNGTDKSPSASRGHCVAFLGDGLLNEIGQHSGDLREDCVARGEEVMESEVYARRRSVGEEKSWEQEEDEEDKVMEDKKYYIE